MSERTKRILHAALKLNENESNASNDIFNKKIKVLCSEDVSTEDPTSTLCDDERPDAALRFNQSNEMPSNNKNGNEAYQISETTDNIPLKEITNRFQVIAKYSPEDIILTEVPVSILQHVSTNSNQSQVDNASIQGNAAEDWNYECNVDNNASDKVQTFTVSSFPETFNTEGAIIVENCSNFEDQSADNPPGNINSAIRNVFHTIDIENDGNKPHSPTVEVNKSGADSDTSIFEPDDGSRSVLSSDDMMDAEEIERNQKLQNERNMRKGRPKKGRHNKYPGQTFATRKKMKDSNMTHYTVKGKLKESKRFLNFQCNCPKKCNENVTEPIRKMLFENFWSLGSYDSQTGFIAGTIKEMPVKRKRAKNGSGKSFTRVYRLADVEVCRNMYIQTYQISTKRVNSALTKIREGRLKDERGKLGGKGGKPKLDDLTIQNIIDHINRFPTYISHYARAETQSKFLAPDLREKCMIYIRKKTIQKRKPPMKDTCNKCDLFSTQAKNSDESKKQAFETAHDNHLTSAALARDQMKSDMKEAVNNPLIETLCYDMEKVLGLPKLPINIVYYKRQLSIYNEGIHSASANKPYAFIWKEGVAGRGAQEVGSCLKKFIHLYLEKDTEELIIWSDSCGGLNRNIKIVLMLKYILSEHPTLKTIFLKYLESGHSFLPNDTDFGQIERALKNQVRIYTIDEFKWIIENCKKVNPFVVEVMTPEDFFSTTELEKHISNRKVTVDNNKVNWLKTKVIRIDKSKPFSIFFKETRHLPNTEFKEVDIFKPTRGRKSKNNDLGPLIPLYPNGKPVSIKKCEDIKSLMRFIPLDAREIYKMNFIQEFQGDVDGFGGSLDFQIEVDE